MTTATRPRSLILLAISAACALLTCPAHAADNNPECRFTELARLPLQYTGPALQVTLAGTINGTPANMLLAPQVGDTSLTTGGAERHGLRLEKALGYIRSIGGTSAYFTTRVNDMAVGPLHTGKMTLGVFDIKASYDALAGANFLFQTDMEISLPDKQLKFFQALDCGDEFLGYWPDGAIDVPLQFNPRRDTTPTFTVELNGHKMKAVIDTSANLSHIELKAAQRAGLKLDATGVKRMPDGRGMGKRPAPMWSAPFEKLSIGGETLDHPRIEVIDTQGEFDDNQANITFGMDFLRSHRVLFAISQKKLYLSYVGGQPFGQRAGIEPWMQQEADSGNAEAQFLLARMYQTGRGIPKDTEQAGVWLEKAAAQGHFKANLVLGIKMLLAGRYPEAAARISAGLEKLSSVEPDERASALMLYLLRMRAGEGELGKQELETRLAWFKEEAWQARVAEFFLGRINAAKLLEQTPSSNVCDAADMLAEWHAAQGDNDGKTSVMSAHAACTFPMTRRKIF